MVYVLINVITFVVLLVLSFSIDRSSNISKNSSALVNNMLFLAAITLGSAVNIGLCLWGPFQLSLITGRITYTLTAWFSVGACFYALFYPNNKFYKSKIIVNWIFNIIAFYLMFMQRKGFYGMTTDRLGNLSIMSGAVFDRALIQYTAMTWFQFFQLVFYVVIPFFCFIMILVRAEHTKSRIEKKSHLLNAAGIFSSWLALLFIKHASSVNSMMEALVPIAFLPEALCFVKACETDEIWDGRLILRTSLRILLNNLLPAVLIGCIFAYIYPVFTNYPVVTIILYSIVVLIFGIVWMLFGKLFRKKGYLSDGRYAKRFENEISALDFEGNPMEITEKVFDIFKRNVNSSSLKILIDSGNGTYDSIYSSEKDQVSVKIDTNVFDTLLNQEHPIVFREFIEHKSSVLSIKKEVLQLLDETKSDAFIIINEGRQIVGLIFLGKKITQNAYSEYDYNVFNRVYSNLFVIAYYVKNIMNEDVVGTVNREIRMSGQIITSIQENMDLIKNPKIQVGYSMVPAHNIGGEFVDMIRLSDTRHMFVIGAISGKGIAASMGMVILKSIIRTFLAETTDFKLLVQKVNLFIRESLPKGTFFAGTFGLLDFNTDTLYYINCGTPALFLYTRAYNNVIEIQGEGHILGFAKDISPLIKVKKVKLSPGDIVLACTDGLIETKSLRGEEFGRSRIQNAMMENLSYPSAKMAKFTYDALADFTSKAIEDDITILIMKYQAESN